MENQESRHPCFSAGCAKTFARIHLPVAPACNIQCNYCRRSFDCVNESRPGVTSQVLTPSEARERFAAARQALPNLSVAGIAGPGDALANIDATLETLRLIREVDSSVLFCVSTNGLLLPRHAETLHAAGVTHVTVTMNAVNVQTARRVYRHIDIDGKRLVREEAAAALLKAQIDGIRAAAGLGMAVKVNIVLIKDLNDSEIEAVVRAAKEAGAVMANIMQLIPVKGTLFESLPMTSRLELDAVRKRCEAILPQMFHCTQCRSDACGLLGADTAVGKREAGSGKQEPAPGAPLPTPLRFAVATRSGVLVDEHFGHAQKFRIYEYTSGASRFVEERPVGSFCGGEGSCGGHDESISSAVKALDDCDAVLCLRLGELPRRTLAARGVRAFMVYDYIETALTDAARQLLAAP